MAASQPAGVRPGPDFPGPVALAVLLVVALLATYWPALPGQFLWDDDAHVTAPALRSVGGLARIWFELGATQQYYPLLHSSFWLQHRLWGDSVIGYHLVGILLHALNGVLVCAILRRLSIRSGAAAAAALVWALHPVMAESVAWITEQKNTLSGAFYLGALYAWLGFEEDRRTRSWVTASLLFLLALLCKTVTATLPGAILVITWWRRGRLSWRRDVLPLIPWIIVGAAAGLFTAWVERHVIGAEGADYHLSLVQRLLLAGRVVGFYLGKLVWPVSLNFNYPRWTIDRGSIVAWLALAGTLALLAGLWAVRARARWALAGFLVFVGTLVPVLGFLNVYPFQYSYVADHFQYLASLGILVPLAVAGVMAVKRLAPAQQLPGRVAGVVIILALGVLTWRQAHNYRDPETLFRAVIARNPASWLAHVHLGNIRQSAGEVDEAMSHFETAVGLNPAYFGVHLNIGNIRMQQNRPAEAVTAYERAVDRGSKDALARYSLAAALARLERWPDAIDRYRESLALGIDSALESNARLGLGLALVRVGRAREAVPELEAALAGRPVDAESQCSLALLLLGQGESGKAATYFERALQSRPDYPEALNGLAWIRATDSAAANRNPSQAVHLARRAVELTDGNNPYYLDTLAAAQAAAGSTREAAATARRALDRARADGLTDLVRDIEAHLAAYEAGRSAP